MAGDWIKMRVNLWDDPRISSLVDATDSTEAAVIGALYWLWCAADQHSQDGTMSGLTLKQLDRKVGLPGFSAGLAAIGWIVATETGLRIERFNEHNGASAKNRLNTARRVAAHRERSSNYSSNAENVTGGAHKNPVEATKPLAAPYLDVDVDVDVDVDQSKKPSAPAAPEPGAGAAAGEVPKRIRAPRSDGPKTLHRFAEFWAAYPVKKGKADAMKKWAAKGLDAIADQIIAHVRKMEREDAQWKRSFIPHGSTYINAEGWQDEPAPDPNAIAAGVGAADPSRRPAGWFRSSSNESELQRDIGWVMHRFERGDFGAGADAERERDRLVADVRAMHQITGGA